ncbi:penicillin-binding protein 1A [Flavobacteriaceae bacterium UJ101]|nr:penicillin-binding protein 1A [Flavobacteriaceae bacterium UJ101]
MSNQKPSLTKDKTTKKKYTQKTKKKRSYKKLLFTLWMLFFIGIIAVFAFFYLLANGFIVDLPDTKELENPRLSLASEIISADDKVLGKFYKENRTPIDYSELPQNIVDALVSTEDERYYEHSGIDYEAVARAVGKMGQEGGGSTITQQLAKMLFTGSRDKNDKINAVMQKLGEWVVAVQLEKRFTKEEIIALYLNKFEFNWNAIGIKNAAKLFFNKEPKNLNIEESAVLVGMLKSPSKYNPKRNPNNAKLRREVVLKQMVKNERLTQTAYDSLRLLPLELNYTKFSSKLGTATYFREFLKNEVTEMLQTQGVKKADGTPYDIQLDGLKIYTTIDSRMQENAEDAVKKHLIRHQRTFNREKSWNKKFPFHGKTVGPKTIDTLMTKAMRWTERYKTLKKNGLSEDSIRAIFKKPVEMEIFTWKGSEDTIMSPWDSIRYHKSILQAGLMSMEPQTGYVKAWVGGIDFDHFQYDHVKKGRRQIGSTFKPFVYVTAISEKHYSPCTMISNAPFRYRGSSKTVRGGGGEVSLKKGLAMSLNPVALRLIDKTTPKPVIQLCRDLGITTKMSENDLTIALGSADISLYEMVGAYGAFANKGIYVKPVVVWRVEDKDGRILYENKPETREVFSEEVAYAMIKIMRGSADHPKGTSKWLRSRYNLKNPIACKTGTTNSNSDGWFIGFVPNLVTGVWVGHEDRAAHFASTANGQGAAMALPIWAYYMKDNYKNKKLGISNKKFEEPETESEIDFNCSEYGGFKAFGEPQAVAVKTNPVKVDSIDINTRIQQDSQTSDDELFD